MFHVDSLVGAIGNEKGDGDDDANDGCDDCVGYGCVGYGCVDHSCDCGCDYGCDGGHGTRDDAEASLDGSAAAVKCSFRCRCCRCCCHFRSLPSGDRASGPRDHDDHRASS